MQESKLEKAMRIIGNICKVPNTERISEIKDWIRSKSDLSKDEISDIEKALDDKFNELRDKPGGHYGC